MKKHRDLVMEVLSAQTEAQTAYQAQVHAERQRDIYRIALNRILHDAPSLNWALDEARRALNEGDTLTPDPESP